MIDLSKLESWGPRILEFDSMLRDEKRGRNALQVVLEDLEQDGSEPKPLWRALKPWAVLLAYSAELSKNKATDHPSLPKEGEIWDMAQAIPLPEGSATPDRRAELQWHLITAFWSTAGRLLPSNIAALDGAAQQNAWFEEWHEAFLRAQRLPVGSRERSNAIKDCDCLLELIARLFEMSPIDVPPAADAWFASVDAQAVAYGQAECCRENKLVDPASSDMGNSQLARPLVAALAAVWRVLLARPVDAFWDFLVDECARASRERRPGTREQRGEWIDLLLRHWAAREKVIEELLENRNLVRLLDREITDQLEIPWVPGHELQVALLGPSSSGKTSVMFASKAKGYVDVSTAYRKLGDGAEAIKADEDEVEKHEKKWEENSETNTEKELLIARSKEVEDLASFTFFDTVGEGYFKGDTKPTYPPEFLEARYALRPPSVIMLTVAGIQLETLEVDPHRTNLNNVIEAIKKTPRADVIRKHLTADGKEPDVDLFRDRINASRPVILLISHIDRMIERLTHRYEPEVWGAADVDDDHKKNLLELSLTSEVLRLDDFDLIGKSREYALARLRQDRELLRSPPRLRIIIDTLGKLSGVVQMFSEAGLSNLQILFIRPIRKPEYSRSKITTVQRPPEFPGINTLWQHLTATVVRKSAVARKKTLNNTLVTQLTSSIEKLDSLEDRAAKFSSEKLDLRSLDVETFRKAADAVGLTKYANRVSAGKVGPEKLYGYVSEKNSDLKMLVDDLCSKLVTLDLEIDATLLEIMKIMGVPAKKEGRFENFGTFVKSGNAVGEYPYTEGKKFHLDWLQDERETYDQERGNRYRASSEAGDSDEMNFTDRLRSAIEDIAVKKSAEHDFLLTLIASQQRIIAQRIPAPETDIPPHGISLHGIHGALWDMCKWRNRDADGIPGQEEQWIKKNANRNFQELLDLNSRGKDQSSAELDWKDIEKALLQLAGFNPFLLTLHVGLFESDRHKVYAVETTLKRPKDESVSHLAVAALKDLRDLGRHLRTDRELKNRLQRLGALAALKPLLTELGYRPETVFDAIAQGRGGATYKAIMKAEQDLRDIKEGKNEKKAIYEYVIGPFGIKRQIRNRKIAAIGSELQGAEIQTADFIIVGHKGREDSLALRAPFNAVLFTRRLIDQAIELELSPILRNHDGDIAKVFMAELRSLKAYVDNCKDSLVKLHETLKERLLGERCVYLHASKLVDQSSHLGRQLDNLIKPFQPGGVPQQLPSFDQRCNALTGIVKQLLG
jgi:hypothetical protein